jgi:hypothetical protein
MAVTDPIDYIWCALGAVLALPGVIFIAYMVAPRLKFASAVGAFIGGVLGFPITLFVWGSALGSVHLEGAVVLTCTFFIASVTGLTGSLLVNALVGSGNQRPRSTQVEF